MSNDIIDAKKLQAEYDARFRWVLNFRESLPTILRIAEEMQVPMILSRWDIGLAHLRFHFAGNVIGSITKAQPVGNNADGLYFSVGKERYMTHRSFAVKVESPDQLETVCRDFFVALKTRYAEEQARAAATPTEAK